MEPDLLRRRILERLEATGQKRVPVSVALGKGRDYLPDFLNGKKESLALEVIPFLSDLLECRPDYLMDPAVEDPEPNKGGPHVPIIGRVGADAEGTVIQSTGQEGFDTVPIPPGGSRKAVALEVVGDSMPLLAANGSLIFFENQRTPPTPDMLGYYVIAELDDGRVLFKQLQRGSRPGLWGLQSQVGPLIEDVRIVWAAEPTAIIPPKQARRIILRAGERQVA